MILKERADFLIKSARSFQMDLCVTVGVWSCAEI